MSEKKILIVDYDARALEALSELFKPYRYEISRASDGVTAYEKFRLENPDLVILEAILPKLHGFDLTRRIHQESKGRVPVIVVTGLYRGPQYKHEALATYGAAEFIEKPYDEEYLVRTVTTLLKERVDIDLDTPTSSEVVDFLKKRLPKA
ncbi:MAG: response regulator [Candidatus Aminicenantes bacterium]|nr:response regulator [Candidatus Aminicenantes bacterium]